MALINGIIPTAKFELIRDRIGQILVTEFANQAFLTGNNELKPAVYSERFIPVDKTEPPVVNVCFASGTYDNKNVKSVDGNYIYNLDFYTSAKSAGGETGDTAATKKLHRLMAVARAIIENPRYRTLGYNAPFNCNIGVNDIQVSDPSSIDSTHKVQGRLTVSVRVPETVELIDNMPLLSTSLTQVQLFDTDKGYRYEWASVNSFAVPGGNSFTLPLEYTGLTVRVVSDGTQSYNSSAFTQDGDNIVMNDAVFTAGQLLTLTLVVNDYTADITVAIDGASFTLPAAYEGKAIQFVNDGTQSYVSSSFTQVGLTIAMTNGVVFTSGQVVSIWYGLQLVSVTASEGDTFVLPSIYRNHEQALVFDGNQSYDSTQFGLPEVITTMTNGTTFYEGQELIIAVR